MDKQIDIEKSIKSKPRQANFDLMRILCMLMIVMLHFCTHGLEVFWGDTYLPMSDSTTDILNYIIVGICVIVTSIAVNCYVLLTGYFSITPLKLNFNRLSRLWLQVAFYSFFLTLVFNCLGGAKISNTNMMLSILPVTVDSYWFFTKYIALVLMIPFLAIIPTHINKKQFEYFLCLLLMLNLSLVYSHGGFPFGVHYSSWDSLFWFVTLYYIGNYLRRYSLPDSIKTHANLYLVISIIIIAVFYYFLNVIKSYGIFTGEPNHPLYNGVLIIPTVLFFIGFQNLKISKFTGYITSVSSLSFGVYLIHDHPAVRLWLWHDVLNVKQYLHTSYLPLLILGLPIAIFTVCIIIEKIRTLLFIGIEKLITKSIK